MNAEISDLHESSVAVAVKVTVTQTRVRAHKLASNARCVMLVLTRAQNAPPHPLYVLLLWHYLNSYHFHRHGLYLSHDFIILIIFL